MTDMQMLFILALVLIWALLQWRNRMPRMYNVHVLFEALNSRGGNIIILLVLSMYFFARSMQLFILLMDLSKPGIDGRPSIAQDNAFALMALQFATASAFGGAFGSMLKTMTGSDSRSRSEDRTVNTPGASGQ